MQFYAALPPNQPDLPGNGSGARCARLVFPKLLLQFAQVSSTRSSSGNSTRTNGQCKLIALPRGLFCRQSSFEVTQQINTCEIHEQTSRQMLKWNKIFTFASKLPPLIVNQLWGERPANRLPFPLSPNLLIQFRSSLDDKLESMSMSPVGVNKLALAVDWPHCWPVCTNCTRQLHLEVAKFALHQSGSIWKDFGIFAGKLRDEEWKLSRFAPRPRVYKTKILHNS